MKTSRTFLVLAALLIGASSVSALPSLQLYIDGATYDDESQTWVIGSLTNIDLYVVGNANLNDVIISAALSTGEFDEFTDPNGIASLSGLTPTYPSNPDWVHGYSPFSNFLTQWNGGDDDLQRHGIFPSWYSEFNAGDFGMVGGVGNTQPGPEFFDASLGYIPLNGKGTNMGEIKMFTISVTGATAVHFDVYTTNADGTIAEFAPFSHDAAMVPEPATMLLFGIGIAGAGVVRRFRKKV